MQIKEFFDKPTFTLTYVVFDEATKDAVVIDPVLNYEPHASKVSYESVNEVKEFVRQKELKVHLIMETHAHADHLTSAQSLKEEWPNAQTIIHENIRLVQKTFKDIFNFDEEFDTEGRRFDKLVKDGEILEAGRLKIEILHTPGHTPACVSYLINQSAVFTGDALFMPDFGTGRCDFPKGSAKDLYNSIQSKLYTLPDDVKVYVGHDYQPGDRDLEFQTTIGAEKRSNIQLREATTESEFVQFRENRDKNLPAPRLLLPSIQVNSQNGNMPKKEENGVSYLKIPIRKG